MTDSSGAPRPRAIVTGGARGIGGATVRVLAEEWDVMIVDVLDDVGQALADELGEHVAYRSLDVTDLDQWRAVVADVEARWGPVTGLVNAAGILSKSESILEVDAATFRHVMEVNLMGTLFGIQAVAPSMERGGGGSIVNISSVGGIIAVPTAAPYVTSKWAVRGLTKAAAIELAASGIRVNSVHPGAVDTDMLRSRQGKEQPRANQRVLLRRTAQPSEMATGIQFLLSNASSYMTGTELVIDGGMTAN